MITLDIDLSYLTSNFNIGTSKLSKYHNKSIIEIMEIEAKNGNLKAAKFVMQMASNPNEILKLFQLINPKNRFLILANMNQNDLMNVMQYLKPEELALGLSIFTQEVLVKLLQNLPPESLAIVLLETMGAEDFIKLLPEKYLDEFLSSDKIQKDMLIKALANIDEEQLQKMMEKVTGTSCYDDKDSIIQQMSNFNEDNFRKMIFLLEPEGKQQLISSLIVNKPELFEEFSIEAMTYPFTMMEKTDILKSLSVLDTQEMLPMFNEMPQEIMALVATQIDPQIFSEILAADFSDIIANCGINI